MNSVLIIDDDKELCALMKKCVEQEQLSVLTAHGGVAGLRLAEENAGSLALVILDVMMPDIDGFQVLQHMAAVNKALVLQEVSVLSAQLCNDTLEDYFKKITGGGGIA